MEEELRAAGLRPELIIFLSKHAARSGQASLTVHPLGNFTEAKYGGRPGRFTPTLGSWQTYALRLLDHHRRAANHPAPATFEVTHHGPLLATPAFFLELGSTPAQWEDPAGAGVVARAAWDLARSHPAPHPIMIGLGGGHYAPRHTEAALGKAVDFAHLVPSHAAESVAEPDRLVAEIVRSSPGAEGVYVHSGTVERGAEARWLAAFAAAGVPQRTSREWTVASAKDFMRPP